MAVLPAGTDVSFALRMATIRVWTVFGLACTFRRRPLALILRAASGFSFYCRKFENERFRSHNLCYSTLQVLTNVISTTIIHK
jgi:hypothetical protein